MRARKLSSSSATSFYCPGREIPNLTIRVSSIVAAPLIPRTRHPQLSSTDVMCRVCTSTRRVLGREDGTDGTQGTSGVNVQLVARIIARSITLRSSRTFPGQGYRCRSRRGGMSSTRSRNGGMAIGNTFTRLKRTFAERTLFHRRFEVSSYALCLSLAPPFIHKKSVLSEV
jgi:hypothetical protein